MLQSWDSQRELRAKEILYRCMEDLEATKAALYLAGSEGSFELATSYGFGRRDNLPPVVNTGDPLWDWVRRQRTEPTYLNEPYEYSGLRALLDSAGTSHLLTIPLTVGDRLVGLVDVRDKARKAPFGPLDVGVARAIAEALEGFLAEFGIYGKPPQKPAQVSGGAAPHLAAPPATPAPRPQVSDLPQRWVVEELTGLLKVLSRLPGIAATVLVITDGRTVRALALRTLPLDANDREALVSHQTRALQEPGLRLPPANAWSWEERESGGRETQREEIRTAVLHAGPPVWVMLSVLTPGGSPAAEPVILAAAHSVALARMVRDYRRAARNLARALLEPGETPFAHLRQHSQGTSELAQRLAAALRLSEKEEELITVAAYLHDVGMRELDYARVYRIDRPGEPERQLFLRHPEVGARIVENTAFPGELAAAILHHHERWDGRGYPKRLAGRNIPLVSRIIHIAEVYDVLTSPTSYRRPAGRDNALSVIRAEAGRQFDPDLVPVLAEVVRT
jgi:putative nucleotidyltransferase with HDIG domain